MGGGRVADGTSGTAFFLATFFLDGAGEAAFFLVAVANGAGERELRTSRAGPCCRGWSGAEEVAEGDGLGGRAAAAVVDGAGERELPLSMAAVAEGRPPLLKLRQSDGRTDDVVRWLRWRRRRRPQTDGRQGVDRTTRSKGSTDSEPRTLPDLMDQKWSPYGSFFWAGSKNLWAEPNHAHRERYGLFWFIKMCDEKIELYW